MRKTNRGTVVVEGALIMIPMLVIMIALFEAGWFMYFQNTLTNVAREGAKQAARPLSQTDTLMNQGEIRTYVENYLSTIGVTCPSCVVLTNETVTMCGGCMPPQVADFVRIKVTVPYNSLTLRMFNIQGFQMKGEAFMRKETSAY